jgi:hypothetical protein
MLQVSEDGKVLVFARFGVAQRRTGVLGHLVVGVAVVVRATSRYQVVEKIGAAARVARGSTLAERRPSGTRPEGSHS